LCSVIDTRISAGQVSAINQTSHPIPPGPKFPWLAYARVYLDPLRTLTRAVRRYGDVVHFRVGRRHHFLFNHPDTIRAVLLDTEGLRRSVQPPLKHFLGKGLLSSEGKFHQSQRRMIQPAFHKERIAAFGEIMTRESARLRDRWQHGATVDMREEMLRLTMAIVGKTLFNVDFESEAADLSEALDEVVATTGMKYAMMESLQKRIPLFRSRRLQRARERLDRLIYQMIAERRAGDTQRTDVLSMLVRIRDGEDAPRGMTDEQVRDEILTLFTAGHETIANALMWTWYLLAQNPGVAEKFHAELDRVLAGRLPVIGDLENLPYTRMVFAESMRIYPPVWIMGRRALEDREIGGYLIPKRSLIHISQFLMHRDPRYFPDPERFDPERWTPEAAAARPKFSYFPFGGGGLQCIGEGFAWTEGMFVMATLAGRWRMRVAPDHRIVLEPQITLRSRHGMPMILEQRK
jgi:cytochrome P450